MRELNQKDQGFTLVELAIMLVIIGLIISGILVSQSMISTTRVLRLSSDLGKYDIAVNNFRIAYRRLPGDDPFFLPPGNSDNVNTATNGSALCQNGPNQLYSKFEYFQGFSHLSQGQVLDKNYVPFSPVSCGGNHTDNYSDKRIAPFVTLDSKASAAVGASYDLMMLRSNPMDLRLYIFFIVSSADVKPLFAKLGPVQNGVGPSFAYSISNCRSSLGTFAYYDCDDPLANFGDMAYYTTDPNHN